MHVQRYVKTIHVPEEVHNNDAMWQDIKSNCAAEMDEVCTQKGFVRIGDIDFTERVNEPFTSLTLQGYRTWHAIGRYRVGTPVVECT
jgi:hypothetical protein